MHGKVRTLPLFPPFLVAHSGKNWKCPGLESSKLMHVNFHRFARRKIPAKKSLISADKFLQCFVIRNHQILKQAVLRTIKKINLSNWCNFSV